MNVDKVVNLVEEYEKCKEEAEKLIKKGQKKLTEARELCPHPATTEERDYYEGGYMNTAYTTVYTNCAICGKRLNQKTIDHGYYG